MVGDSGIIAVVQAIFDCPDYSLYTPNPNIIGEGVENPTRYDPEDVEAETERWRDRVGVYFTNHGFEEFISGGQHTLYHAFAVSQNIEIRVQSISADPVVGGSQQFTVEVLIVDAEGNSETCQVGCQVVYKTDTTLIDRITWDTNDLYGLLQNKTSPKAESNTEETTQETTQETLVPVGVSIWDPSLNSQPQAGSVYPVS